MQRHALRSTARCLSRWVRPSFQQKYGTHRFASPFKSFSTSQAAQLQDEYNDSHHDRAFSSVFHVPTPFQLENGRELHNVDVAYTTYGTLNDARDNVIVVCHAFAGQSQVHQWWEGIVAEEWTDKYFLVCANVLGSCYGTTGPTSINPLTGVPYGASFPAVTIRDAVRLQIKLLQEGLGIPQIRAVIGGSLGGMQTLEWAFLGGPDYVKSFVAIACNSHHTAWQIGVSEVQRQAIYMDPSYQNGLYDPSQPPAQGLALARQIAMISYRTHVAYDDKYGRDVVSTKNDESPHPYFQVQSYLHYQGQKIISRFDANTYVTLTHLMDTHDVGRGRGGVNTVLSSLKQPALVLGIDSDVLYPLSEQQFLAHHLPNAEFHAVESPHGHDGFLLEQDTVCAHALAFIDQQGN